MEYNETEKMLREIHEIPDDVLTEDRYREAIKFDMDNDMPSDEDVTFEIEVDGSLETRWERHPKMIVLELCNIIRSMRIDSILSKQDMLPKTQLKTKMPKCKPPKEDNLPPLGDNDSWCGPDVSN